MTPLDRTPHERDRFAAARTIGDAVLYEGYVLYPYRASARKNQVRWQFGVLVPPAFAELDPSERATMRTEVVVDPGARPVLDVRIRCLQVQRRQIESVDDLGGTATTDALDVDGVVWVPWEEAVEHEIDLPPVRLLPFPGAHVEHRFTLPTVSAVEAISDGDGRVLGRAVRTCDQIDGIVRVAARWADGDGALVAVSVTVGNETTWVVPDDAARGGAMCRSLVAVHTLLAIGDGAFVSLLDPPESAVEAVAACRNEGTFPVLVGDESSTALVLSSPIILYDHPAIAPQSDGDFCDATEIDEILALRVLTLTDAEKAEARGTDARAAAIVERCDSMAPDDWARLHGVVRPVAEPPEPPPPAPPPWWDPGIDGDVDPFTDSTWIGGTQVGRGTPVRLRPTRRADAHDLFLADRPATVVGVFRDVDGGEHIAVTLDDDPASEVFEWQRRYLYFHPDEIEVVRGSEVDA